jgi:hypothetical protein
MIFHTAPAIQRLASSMTLWYVAYRRSTSEKWQYSWHQSLGESTRFAESCRKDGYTAHARVSSTKHRMRAQPLGRVVTALSAILTGYDNDPISDMTGIYADPTPALAEAARQLGWPSLKGLERELEARVHPYWLYKSGLLSFALDAD